MTTPAVPLPTGKCENCGADLGDPLAFRHTYERDCITELIRRAEQRAAAGDKFKAFVHSYLDSHGVPADDPENEHSKEGCRIGARLDLLFARSAWLNRLLNVADQLLHGVSSVDINPDCWSLIEALSKVVYEQGKAGPANARAALAARPQGGEG